MKYFKYWVKEKFQIEVGGTNEEISILSGSNKSKALASAEAKQKARLIQSRVADGGTKEDYEVPIKEHVSEIIDESNVVSVCRYGAKILNTNQFTILDLDDYPVDFFDLFKSYRKMTKKERIVAKFEERIKKLPQLGADFRIYETAKGIRVIGKTYLAPSSPGYVALMRKLFVDWVYIQMSAKQNCYRARLTPKPYRMKFRTIKVADPLVCETSEYLEWEQDYADKARSHVVVKLIKTIGRDFSQELVIKYHDAMCNLHGNGRLA